MAQLIPTQADREAAADALKASFITPDMVAANTRAGGADNGPFVQAFARHALAAHIEALEEAAKLCDEMGEREQSNFGLGRSAQNYYRARNAIRSLTTIAGGE